MVIRSNRGFGTLVPPGVFDTSGWVGIVPGDLIYGDGTSGFSRAIISSSHIGSKPLGSPLLVIGSSVGILDIFTRSKSFCN
jgi:hypothetical protein